MGAIHINCLLLLIFAHTFQGTVGKVPSLLIHGGERVNITKAPFMAIFKNVDEKFVCGAAIINILMLLSAAHCYSKKGTSVVYVGVSKYTKNLSPNKRHEIKEVVMHPEASGDDAPNDICVIILKETLTFSARVMAIPMADASLIPKANELTTAYGYGISDRTIQGYLLKVDLPFVERDQCSRMYGKTVPIGTVCVGGEEGEGVCNGDSGGSVVFKDHLLGIVSAAAHEPCAEDSYPALITHIPEMRTFIDGVLIKNPVPSPPIRGNSTSVNNITDVPFMAIFKIFTTGSFCGAVIIHPKMLLSAARCNNSRDKRVVIVGTNIYSPNIKPLRGQYYTIKNVVNHPGALTNANEDLCVIILNKKIRFSDNVKPIPIAEYGSIHMPKDGELVTIYGFGKTEPKIYLKNLIRTDVPIVEKGRCVEKWTPDSVSERMLCVDGEVGMGCDGDSGGPVVFKGVLLGIHVGRPESCSEPLPEFITDIPKARRFIDSVMKNNPDTQCAFKITGGTPAQISDAPFVASFKLEDERFTCAATVVHEQFLLTTAHCIYELKDTDTMHHIMVTAGSNTNGEGFHRYPVDEIFIHPNFDYDTYDYDLAVIKMVHYMNLGGLVRKIEMADWTELTHGAPVTVYGFTEDSSTSTVSLHKLVLPYYNWRMCKDLYARNTGYPITYQMFCAGEIEKEDACAGDSGGPVIYNNVLLGLTSWGGESCKRKYPSVFTHIPPLKSYVEEIIRNNKDEEK